MPIDRFFIAPYDKSSGMQTNARPWLIPDEAFAILLNAYVFRGRIRKRFGSTWLGDSPLLTRLRVQVNTLAGGAANGIVPGIQFKIGQAFSIGTEFFTVFQANGAMLDTGVSATHTFNTANGAYSFTGVTQPNGTAVFWYPALPVMGLLVFENAALENELTIAFDTEFAYQYLNGWTRLAGEITPGAATWTGTDSQFFWGTTWTGADPSTKVFFVTNFNQNEPNFMRFFVNGNWDNFRPQIDAVPDFLNSALILVPFKNRLIAFNTWEGPVALPGLNYQNRARWSQVGSPLDALAWRQDLAGRGNALDCPTTESIVTVEFVKDRLIVFFERSTWEFVYTGNQAYPFAWQQINTELGAESTFSVVPFDKVCIGIGNVGIHACNGSNVERIDDKIPDEVFQIHNANTGIQRVYGIRDYSVEMVYWTFPDEDDEDGQNSFPYPNRILVYNYKNGTWSFNDDSITVFGYFWPQLGITWDSNQWTWDSDISWSGGAVQSLNQQVIAGNQEGYTFLINPNMPRNASVLQITNIAVALNQVTITAFNHNLRVNDYILITGIVDSTGNLQTLNNTIVRVDQLVDANTFSFSVLPPPILAGTYQGGGLIARVSNIFIFTKEYNFYAEQGRNAYVSKIDFMVDSTSEGQIAVNFFASTSTQPLLLDAIGTGTLMGTGTLTTFPTPAIPFEADADRLWHSVYIPAEGEVIQLFLNMTDAQMRLLTTNSDGSISGPALEDFQMHAMIIFAQPTSTRLQ